MNKKMFVKTVMLFAVALVFALCSIYAPIYAAIPAAQGQVNVDEPLDGTWRITSGTFTWLLDNEDDDCCLAPNNYIPGSAPDIEIRVTQNGSVYTISLNGDDGALFEGNVVVSAEFACNEGHEVGAGLSGGPGFQRAAAGEYHSGGPGTPSFLGQIKFIVSGDQLHFNDLTESESEAGNLTELVLQRVATP